MTPFYFDNVDVTVNKTGILCDNASLSISNSLKGLYTLGRRGVINSVTAGPLTNNLSLSYLLDVSNEPNYRIVDYLKTGHQSFLYEAIPIAIAGLTGSYFLQDYNIRISTNDIPKVSVNYTSYLPLTGNLFNKAGDYVYYQSGLSGLAHGWTTYIRGTGGNYLAYPCHEFEYDFKASWEPVFTLFSSYPSQIQFMSAEERMTLVQDNYTDLSFSGQNAQDFWNFGAATGIDVLDLAFMRGDSNKIMTFCVTGSISTKNDINVSNDNPITVTSSVIRYY